MVEKSAAGLKRALPALAATVLKNPKVQEAVVDKGLEVMNKLVDKQLRIIDEAQEKASNFLAKEVCMIYVAASDWIQMDFNRLITLETDKPENVFNFKLPSV